MSTTGTLRRRLAALRQPLPAPVYARLTRVAVVLLGLIVVTGAAVRLTGSGLGCPTWPECGDGSFVARSQFALHGVVEFSNRVVSLGVGLVIAAVVIGSLRLRERRRELTVLSAGLVLGFVAQAVLGGLTVLFHLNPALVAWRTSCSRCCCCGTPRCSTWRPPTPGNDASGWPAASSCCSPTCSRSSPGRC